MALQEAGGTLASKEKIPFFVREAVKWVDITDFILLRFGLSNLPETERDQIKEVASVIRTEQMEAPGEGEIFNLSDKIEPSGDFRIIISMNILKNTPLPVYLAAQYERLKNKGKDYQEDRDFIAKVAGAAGISFARII